MSVTYIVPWKAVVGADFLEEFSEISRGLAGKIVDEGSAERIKNLFRGVTAERQRLYWQKRDMMLVSGYELRSEKDTGRWRGWYSPYLGHNDELKFHTTAQPGRVEISMTDFLSYRHLCRLEDEENPDKERKLVRHARYMASKYGVTVDAPVPLPGKMEQGPLQGALSGVTGRVERGK